MTSSAFLSYSFYPSFRPLNSSPLISPRNAPLLLKMISHFPDGGITSPKGFKAAGYTAGFKPSGQPDLALVTTHDGQPVPAAAVFTTNLVRAAPVTLSEAHMKRSSNQISAVLINAGQANAATGDAGLQDALLSAVTLADELSVATYNIFICSTGVIGRRIDMSKMTAAIPQLVSATCDGAEASKDAAIAITTTDLVHKQIAFQDEIGGHTVTVGGMCKGSGMIHPSMATMLAVITCDADIIPSIWQGMLKRAVDKSFNAITVDGDTSTNDVVCALASGKSGLSITSETSDEASKLEQLLTKTCEHLAKSVARDGEGATVLLEVQVSGAKSDENAMRVAKAVVSSSLVKSAVFGHDPNWGRIAAAAGRSGALFDQSYLKISIGNHLLMDKGTPLDFDAKAASQYMVDKSSASTNDYMTEKDTVMISVQVGDGSGTATAWGCDLSYKYVEINAEYTT